jgi:hypothetical protein
MSTPTFTPNDQPVGQPQTTRFDARYAPQQESRQCEHRVVSREEILRSGHRDGPMLLSEPMVPSESARPAELASPERPIGVGVDQQRLWAGGAASAVVVALVALVGVLVSRWVFGVPVLAPQRDGAYGDVHTTVLIVAAAGAALAATGLAGLLMLGTLRPRLFFGWIVALVTAIAVAAPFGTVAALDGKVATAVVNLAVGVAVGVLVSGVAGRSVPAARPASAGIR